LATVQSIITQTLRGSQDPLVVREAIETRIAAISRSHDLLSRQKWDGAGLRDLVGEALAPFGGTDSGNRRFTIQGENIWLSPRATLALGIAINELATNAVKYGALSNEAGKVSISWTTQNKSAERWLCIHWRETGGPPVRPPTSKGFGSRVIEHGLALELGGEITLEFSPKGIVCTINVPAPEAIVNG
jgi:two-component sensor histidine kinase